MMTIRKQNIYLVYGIDGGQTSRRCFFVGGIESSDTMNLEEDTGSKKKKKKKRNGTRREGEAEWRETQRERESFHPTDQPTGVMTDD